VRSAVEPDHGLLSKAGNRKGRHPHIGFDRPCRSARLDHSPPAPAADDGCHRRGCRRAARAIGEIVPCPRHRAALL